MPYESLSRNRATQALRRVGGFAGDYGDIRFSVQKMAIGSVGEAEGIHDKFFPHDVLSNAAREVVARALASNS